MSKWFFTIKRRDRDENDRRSSYPLTHSTITQSEFAELARKALRFHPSMHLTEIQGAKVRISFSYSFQERGDRVEHYSASYTLDFNDYGEITGRCWFKRDGTYLTGYNTNDPTRVRRSAVAIRKAILKELKARGVANIDESDED